MPNYYTIRSTGTSTCTATSSTTIFRCCDDFGGGGPCTCLLACVQQKHRQEHREFHGRRPCFRRNSLRHLRQLHPLDHVRPQLVHLDCLGQMGLRHQQERCYQLGTGPDYRHLVVGIGLMVLGQDTVANQVGLLAVGSRMVGCLLRQLVRVDRVGSHRWQVGRKSHTEGLLEVGHSRSLARMARRLGDMAIDRRMEVDLVHLGHTEGQVGLGRTREYQDAVVGYHMSLEGGTVDCSMGRS